MTRTSGDDLRQELSRSRAIGVWPTLTKPEDPREFGRRVARETFERYVTSRDSTEHAKSARK